jgi:hypothetical protein
MSTNYYAKHPDFDLPEEGLHIGKSAAGWMFYLRVWDLLDFWVGPELPYPSSLGDWVELLASPGWTIEDDCGAVFTLSELVKIITDRPRDWKRQSPSHDVTNGPGTWDNCFYEFS